ncbi:class A beta-lactamase-related serine hydrolase [Solimonas sp. K1W22B-7]|uniref:serine hydrolase domain-containing protein n=1 Tax=Solimonas sp. K1W22B-7 TaxID=2303331 RepID=UPI000E32D897|nr:serine hydrolase domain-containing protein [Solimonas sp. K1W22B-7]AXQ27200.1 class A beta-lactamase-related serine hydrolase [Solimonas sp. K1W22B-7]
MTSVQTFARSLSMLAVVALAACSLQGSDEPSPAHDWAALSEALDNSVGTGDAQVTGYSFALNVDGRTVFERAGGDMTQAAVIPIASASKAPAAAALMTLEREGLVNLDVPVSSYLGEAVTWPAAKSGITLRMLLNHTSGLPMSSPCLDDTATITLQECVTEIAGAQLDFLPGTRFGYSAAGYQVAGYIAERVTGKTWATLFRERITGPLHMDSFSYGDMENPRIAGGAVSNAADYLRFSQMVLGGGKPVLTPAQVQALQHSQVDGLPVFFTPAPAGANLVGYSLGWWISAPGNHPGSNGPEISDPGLLGTTPWIDFGERYTAVLLINGTPEKGLAIWNAARAAILAELLPQ